MSPKIYFAPTPWSSSEETFEDYRHQTPNNRARWVDIEAVRDPAKSDYLVIQDTCADSELLKKFPPAKRLYLSREALTPDCIKDYPANDYVRFSFWDGSGYLATRWIYNSSSQAGYTGLDYDYDSLLKLAPPKKANLICSIQSNKRGTEGHRIRLKFLKDFALSFPIDIFGSVSFHNCELIENKKSKSLIKYKYCLGFDNQDSINDFFGTQFTDSILMWTIPIFWCGTDLSRYFPEKSFIQFDARNLGEISRIRDLVAKDDYESRLPALAEARNLILNEYNLWPTIKKSIDRFLR